MGLAQIHGFAHQFNGSATVDSAPGRDTEVAILLPRTGAASGRNVDSRRTAAEVPRGHSETVLLVEDTASCAVLWPRLLQSWATGYWRRRMPTRGSRRSGCSR
ncbi:hypothetical protein JMJ56_21815 [Belnapia sp. T18]|uniref:Uncharacterized protein n=1 Tax=Belnapia arida TaxID=2804533 RepID=A0ABS1U7J7_9PROT|nr:hypothetical protein [Belnapia arida]MBL6080659.1 hypothetical protein [Belnapia arida]